MDDPQGRIVALLRRSSGIRAVVDVDARAVCRRCASGRGCGAGVFGSTQRQRRIEALLAPGIDVDEGDRVRLSLSPRNVLRAAGIVYGAPLLGMAAGAGFGVVLGYGLASDDAVAAALTILGLILGIAVGCLKLRRQECLTDFVPTVAGRLGRSGG